MSRFAFRVAALAVFASTVFAGSAAAQGVGVGVKGGPVFASFSSDALDFSNRTGLQAGIFFGGNRPGTIGVMGEVNYIRKKTYYDDLATEIRVDYIQVPVLLRINAGSHSRNGVSVYGLVGPAVDIKVGDEIQGFSVTDAFEGVDFSLQVGAGVELSRFIVEGRYTKGFRRINKQFTDFAEVKSQAFAILFGVRFN
ncbi:MAG: outer membrane beta-barrel protein [Vicinamibacterales bacterium]